MKLLITGGAGFIGSHAADAALAAGHDVHVLDNLSGGRTENVPAGATFHQLDIRDDAAAELVAAERFEGLLHFAAQMDVRKSVADPRFDADVNVLGLLNLLDAGRQHGLRKVVFASTGGAIYGEPDPEVNGGRSQPEEHPAWPVSPYGITKLVGEKYLHFFNLQYGLPWVALRFGNVYGPRQNPHGEAGVVAIFAERMLDGQDVFVNGHGEQTRDYVFVGDVVRAVMAALDHGGSGYFNVGTGRETSVNELFRHVNALTGGRTEERHRDAAPGEQQRSVLDTAKIRETMGWEARTPLEDGLAETVAWFRSRRPATP